MNGKKWCICVIISYFSLLLAIGGCVFVVDPYFHYHTPIEGISYEINRAEYMNDGIAKHFDYNAMIIGTSMTRNFRTAEAEKLFGGKFVRITYLGEGFKRINNTLQTAIATNPELKFVIRGIDPIWFVTDANWDGYDEYPEYLFDNNIWNDVCYLYNKNVFIEDVVPEVIRTIKGEPAKSFDDYINFEEAGGKDIVLKEYQRREKENKVIKQSETDEMFRLMNNNIEQNVISSIKDNPDITFYIFIPPYSICWWDGLNQYGTGVLERRIDMEKATIEKLLQYENVRLFSFFNNYELICNLDNYGDDVHYVSKVNSQILQWMKEGKFELTKENYEAYINEIKEFYSNYDYESIFSLGGY